MNKRTIKNRILYIKITKKGNKKEKPEENPLAFLDVFIYNDMLIFCLRNSSCRETD